MQTIKDFVINALIFLKPELKTDAFMREKLYRDYIKLHKLDAKKLNRQTSSSKPPKILKVPTIAYTWTSEELLLLGIIASVHKVEVKDVLSISRKREVGDCRKQAMALFHICFDYSTVKAGKMFMRDHSTIIHACESHVNLLSVPGRYRRLFDETVTELQAKVPEAFVRLTPREIPKHRHKLIQLTKWEEHLRPA